MHRVVSRLVVDVQWTTSVKLAFKVILLLYNPKSADPVVANSELSTAITNALSDGSFVTALRLEANQLGSAAWNLASATSSGLSSNGFTESPATANPTSRPSVRPTARPSASPTGNPRANPTANPTVNPIGKSKHNDKDKSKRAKTPKTAKISRDTKAPVVSKAKNAKKAKPDPKKAAKHTKSQNTPKGPEKSKKRVDKKKKAAE